MLRTNPAIVHVVRRLETLRDDLATAPVALIDELRSSYTLEMLELIVMLEGLPPVSGSSPEADDEWTLTPPDALGWDAWTDESRWMTTEPTPLSVLADEAPFNADYDAWLERLACSTDCVESRFSEADAIAAFGC